MDALPPFWRPHQEKIEAFKHACHGLVMELLVCFALAMDLPDRNLFAKAHAENEGDGNQFRCTLILTDFTIYSDRYPLT